MLQFHTDVIHKAILSLRDGHPVGQTVSAVINPDNLKIEGFYSSQPRSREQSILLAQDIRETTPKGYIVDDADVLTEPDELVRLKRILDINFDPLGKQVRTVSGKKIGKVSEYSVEIPSLYIKKLYVSRSLMRTFNGNSLLAVDRTQVNEVTDKEIIINDLEATARVAAPAPII